MAVNSPSNLASSNNESVASAPIAPVVIEEEVYVPATGRQKFFVVLCLFIVTFIFLYLGEQVLQLYDKSLANEIKVSWKAEPGVTLASGPASFLVDHEQSKLLHRGPIDNELKKNLLALIRIDGKADDTQIKKADSFYRAIDRLAYNANANSYPALYYLMILAGIGGLVGVQIRSISNFIGVSCIKNKLDLKRWWPWYALRPLLGFLFGILVVVLVKAELFLGTESQMEHDNLWWLGLAMLTGFGASDFGDRLRLLTQTLFGKNN